MKEKWIKGKWVKGLYLLLVFGLVFQAGCAKEQKDAGVGNSKIQNPGIKVTFFDVGKGDAILVETKEERMLIDSGYEDTHEVILDYFKEAGIQKLDYLVITHFDKDHVGGADWILKETEVAEILQPAYRSDGGQYLEYEDALQELGITPRAIAETFTFSLGEAQCLVYPPQQQEYEEEDNDFSLVLSMTYGQERFLFAGDCEKERLQELLNQEEFDLEHQVLKVPHHGRKEKNSEEFLEAVSPKVAVITCSEEEPADKKVLQKLKALGTETYLTAKGTVTCVSDGSTLQAVQE